MLSDHNEIKLEISNRKVAENFIKTWKLMNLFMSNPYVNRKSKETEKNALR